MRLGKYKHYKGKYYEVVGVAKHSETLKELVVYRSLNSDGKDLLWARPKDMFLENVNVDGKLIKRFEHVEKS